ncbi:DUF1559 domain-containing protein [Zavarzinella formosa]|uniref:DUF1559 domain-containing protein n=1 Tax=Zavarzinella formosa TaxID=360055 RepID=UPI0002F4C08F|nr:DUF1559 domain-containing protein [Zavarzinella formosa]
MRGSSPPRRGLTLIELLVVIAIIVILIGLLVPAVQKIREAANRMRCTSNLKQLGLAIHAYHDTTGYLPPGGDQLCNESQAPHTDRTMWNWTYHLLPYIEQDSLYREPDYNKVYAQAVKTMYCPSRRKAQTYNGHGKTDYAGNAGTSNLGMNGIIVQGKVGGPTQIRFADVTDGLSGTIMLGEKRMNNAEFGNVFDDNEPFVNSGWNDDYECYRTASAQPARDFSKAGETAAQSMFGSAHASGFNVSLGDGSVRYLRFTISLATFQRACVRDDGHANYLE